MIDFYCFEFYWPYESVLQKKFAEEFLFLHKSYRNVPKFSDKQV